jgi:hypothetical protein
MARTTIVFGALLTLAGLVGFWMTGHGHPIWFGLALVLCGWLARTEDVRKRKIWMHIAVTIGLIGFLIPGIMSTVALARAHQQGVTLAQPAIVHVQLVVALICLVYVVLCVRSFIAARRGWNAQG